MKYSINAQRPFLWWLSIATAIIAAIAALLNLPQQICRYSTTNQKHISLEQ
jgi:hypothetical protein